MDWLVFSYSLPTESRSSSRVTLWRRLRRLGALSVAGRAQVLPAREECKEAFDWLAQEIRQAGGEALVLYVTQCTGITDAQMVALFQRARAEEYEELAQEIATLDQAIETGETARMRDALQRLRRQYEAIARTDYFGCPSGAHVAASLARLAQAITPPAPSPLWPMPTSMLIERGGGSRGHTLTLIAWPVSGLFAATSTRRRRSAMPFGQSLERSLSIWRGRFQSPGPMVHF